MTLIFSLERYRAVLDAYMTGLEQRAEGGLSFEALESVASFFVSRVDTEVDRRLSEIAKNGEHEPSAYEALRGQAALANCRLAYEVYEEALSSKRWQGTFKEGGSDAAASVGLHRGQG